MRGVFKVLVYCMMNRNRQMRGVFKMYEDPESPHEGRVEDIR